MTETFHPRRLVNEGFTKGEGKIASQHNVMIEYGDLTFFLISVVCILTVLDISRDRSNEIFTSPPLSGVDQFVEAFHASTQHLEALLRRVDSAVADVTASAETAPQFGADDAVRACVESVAKAQESVNTDRSSFEKEIESSTTSFLNDLRSRAAARPIAPVPQSASDILARQQVISAMENEYPSEAVDEVPGPHYVAPPDPLDDLTPNERVKRQAKAVKDAFQHSWKGYTTYAMGMDELQPRSRSGKNWNEMEGPSNGVGLTVLDSITTMHVMGLRVELAEALEFIKTRLSFRKEIEGSTFETSIRMLGSLLSMYELTGEQDKKLLDMARDIGDRLLWSYNTTGGLPHSTVGFSSHRHFNQQWIGGSAVLSEFGTVQLEMRTLSFHTKDPTYDIKTTHVMDIIDARCPQDMLCPCYMNMQSLKWTTDHVSLGAMGDSFYEYILKQYLLTGKTEERYRKMFLRVVKGITEKLVFRSYPSGWAYVAEYRRGEYYHKMDHLACFVGGMLALGSAEVEGLVREPLLKLAGELTETCVKMYTRQKSGVSPEFVEFPAQQDFINGPGYYILRPETMESLFYMWRFTKDQKWRDYGWKIFRAIDRWCKVETGGYSGLKEVNVKTPLKDNLMQSFWMAETLKYAYLLFADDDAFDLSLWVFNTEAHPLRRRQRDPLDVWREFEKVHGDVPFYPPDIDGVIPTETDNMKQRRARRKGRIQSVHDNLGEDFADGPVDDDGQPYDPIKGARGLPKHPGSDVGGPYVVGEF